MARGVAWTFRVIPLNLVALSQCAKMRSMAMRDHPEGTRLTCADWSAHNRATSAERQRALPGRGCRCCDVRRGGCARRPAGRVAAARPELRFCPQRPAAAAEAAAAGGIDGVHIQVPPAERSGSSDPAPQPPPSAPPRMRKLSGFSKTTDALSNGCRRRVPTVCRRARQRRVHHAALFP